jgi:hypothetical protein
MSRTMGAVLSQRLTDIDRKRQVFSAPTLARDDDLARPPVHVVEREGSNLAGTQPEPNQQ